MTVALKDIKVIPRFRDKIPPQTDEQFQQLEENILSEGKVREPLILWKDHWTLIDGHHRLKVLLAHPGIPYTTAEVELADEDAVDEWIIKNQLGKHNLTPPQISILRAMLYKQEKRKVGGQTGHVGGNQHTSANSVKSTELATASKKGGTAEIVGKKFGVSEKTIREDEKVYDGVERAAKVDPEFKKEIVSGQLKTTKQALADMRELDTDEEVKIAIETIRNPPKDPKGTPKENKNFHEQLREKEKRLANPIREYTFDDVMNDLNSAEDSFLNSIQFILKKRKDVIAADDRAHEQLVGFFESVVHDLEEMKGDI